MNHFENIIELSNALLKAGIKHDVESLYDGGKITFPNSEGDVVCHDFSYGSQFGLFETMGFSWDEGDVTGYLTLEEVTERIVAELGNPPQRIIDDCFGEENE